MCPSQQFSTPPSPPPKRPGNLGKLSLLRTLYSLDFGSCFTFNLMKFKSKYCLRKILYKEKLHFLVSFSFETQFEGHLNDLEQVFKGDTFAQTAAIWLPLKYLKICSSLVMITKLAQRFSLQLPSCCLICPLHLASLPLITRFIIKFDRWHVI